MTSPSRRKKNSRNNMIAKLTSESTAPKKNEPLKPAAPCKTCSAPVTSQDCTWAAEIPVCNSSQSLMRAIQGNCCKSENVLMSHCAAAFCNWRIRSEI